MVYLFLLALLNTYFRDLIFVKYKGYLHDFQKYKNIGYYSVTIVETEHYYGHLVENYL